MESSNRPIVQRTAGLLQLARRQREISGATLSSPSSLITYSPEFSYSEFIYSNGRGKWSATLFSVGVLLTGMALFLIAPVSFFINHRVDILLLCMCAYCISRSAGSSKRPCPLLERGLTKSGLHNLEYKTNSFIVHVFLEQEIVARSSCEPSCARRKTQMLKS
jgi:hypothetical protein